jgi:site-specific DNA-cytosine methylase
MNRIVKRNKIKIEKRKFSSEIKQKNIDIVEELGKKLKIISTFNGIGAFTESLKIKGLNYDMVGVCEINKEANETYYRNNKFVEKNHTDDINDLLQKVKKGLRLDILVQTPPCQSYSLQGKREGLNSENGTLFLTAIDLQKKVDSNVVLYENVKGLVNHHKKNYTYKDNNGVKHEFDSKPKKKEIEKKNLTFVCVRELKYKSKINSEYDGKKKSIGHSMYVIENELLEDTRYNYYWKVINSCDQGLPQNRERIFIIGIKKELDTGFTFPENIDLLFTVEDILENTVPQNFFYKNEEGHELIVENQTKRDNKIHTYAKYSETMTYESTRRVSYPYVSPCITTGGQNKFFIDGKVRLLTPTEMKRVHGFREEFEFVGTLSNQRKQLGNTVSPGVYVRLLTQIIGCVDSPKENIVDITVKKRRFKHTTIINEHISIEKKITNKPDEDYLNLTKERYQEYKSHLENNGTISMTLEKYKTNEDKLNGILEYKMVVTINDLKQLGFRNKKQGVRRYKIIGSKEKLSKVGKRDVLIVRQGGKGKFEDKIDQVITDMGIKDKKLPVVIDGFFGGGGLTLKHIDKLKFDRYIINDLEPLISKTMLAIKKDYKKVQDIYQQVNQEYFELISPELKNYKKDSNCKTRLDPKLQKLRDKDRRYRDFYKSIGKKLNDKGLDIYTISGYFIFFNSRSTNGVLSFKSDKSIDTTNCNNGTTLNDKSNMIKHWPYILNKHKVEVLNKDIFEILEDKNTPKDSLIISDGPYIDVKEDYNFDNSPEFQIKLKNQLGKFTNVIYCN